MSSYRLYLLFFAWLITCAFSNIVEMTTYSDGSYAWSGWVPDTEKSNQEIIKSKVLAAFQDMDNQVTQLQSMMPGTKRPSAIAVIWIEGQGYIYHSSIRGASSTSEATLGIMNDACPHMYQGNCAEMGSIAMAQAPPYNLALRGSLIAVYGSDPKNNGQLGFLQPCSPDGCAEYLDNLSIIPITKRNEINVKAAE